MPTVAIHAISPFTLAFLDAPQVEKQFHLHANAQHRASDLFFLTIHSAFFIRFFFSDSYSPQIVGTRLPLLLLLNLVNRLWPLPALFLSDKDYARWRPFLVQGMRFVRVLINIWWMYCYPGAPCAGYKLLVTATGISHVIVTVSFPCSLKAQLQSSLPGTLLQMFSYWLPHVGFCDHLCVRGRGTSTACQGLDGLAREFGSGIQSMLPMEWIETHLHSGPSCLFTCRVVFMGYLLIVGVFVCNMVVALREWSARRRFLASVGVRLAPSLNVVMPPLHPLVYGGWLTRWMAPLAAWEGLV